MTNQEIADIISIKLNVIISPQRIQIIAKNDSAVLVKVNNMNEIHTISNV